MEVRFENPEWSVEGGIYRPLGFRCFTDKGRDIVACALEKTGNLSKVYIGIDTCYSVIYNSKDLIEPYLVCNVTSDFKLKIGFINKEGYLTSSEIKFLDRLARNLSKALSREESIGPPTKPIIPPGTIIERLPLEVQELIREFAIVPKNPFL